MNKQDIRILIVEDHPLYRIGLRMALSYADSGFSIVKEVDNVKNAKEFIWQNASLIDFVLVDYYLPDGTGLDVIRQVKQYCPDSKILVVSAESHNPEYKLLLEAGINGFVTKDIASLELPLILKSVMQGHDYFDKVMFEQMETPGSQDETDEVFSERELEIVRLSAKGLSAKEIANLLHISPRTVEKHKDRIFSRFCFKSTGEMVNYAMQKGLV